MASQTLFVARMLAAPAARFKREIAAHVARIRCRGQGPLAVFLPSAGKSGAARLRIYNIAERCRDHGWRALVLPPNLSLNQRYRLIAAAKPDVLVMQGVRHSLNRPGLYPDQCILFDMDDADFHLPHLKAPLVRAMPDVAAVVAGSDYVADWCTCGLYGLDRYACVARTAPRAGASRACCRLGANPAHDIHPRS